MRGMRMRRNEMKTDHIYHTTVQLKHRFQNSVPQYRERSVQHQQCRRYANMWTCTCTRARDSTNLLRALCVVLPTQENAIRWLSLL